MAQNIAYRANVLPGYVRIPISNLDRQMAARFGDYLDATLHHSAQRPVLNARVKVHPVHTGGNSFNFNQNVDETKPVRR
jgi:hypothetical protein